MDRFDPPQCPLCLAGEVHAYHRDRRRPYFSCSQCDLVFVPPEFHLTAADEKAEYDLHQNSPDDIGYRRFLRRLADPLLERLAPQSTGLDFGCGPGPTLHLILEEAGHTVALYDKFYAANERALRQTYDFVTATEVVEHLRYPREALHSVWELIRPGGWLAIMTKRVADKAAFANWHYKEDPTHVLFMSEKTFRWLAELWRARLEFPAKDVAILKKPD